MHFDFDQDRLSFRDSLRSLLAKECTPEALRGLCESETGRSRALWSKLAEIGLLGVRVPEAQGGLGLTELDLVLPLEECGRAALGEPVVETAAVAAPLLADIEGDARAERLLGGIAAGNAVVTVGHERNVFVADAHVADHLLLARDDEIHLLARGDVHAELQPGIDPLRRLFRVEWTPHPDTCIARGAFGRALQDASFDRGALATAAEQLGVAGRLVAIAVEYARTREQFGQPIGAFQAIKHMLANVAVRIEFARPVLHRAAYSVATGGGERAVAVSHAKAAASDAATLAAKTALQVHGAIGYTWEVDLHLWMKRAWSLDLAWGSAAWHRERIAACILDGDGRAPSFGFEGARGA